MKRREAYCPRYSCSFGGPSGNYMIAFPGLEETCKTATQYYALEHVDRFTGYCAPPFPLTSWGGEDLNRYAGWLCSLGADPDHDRAVDALFVLSSDRSLVEAYLSDRARAARCFDCDGSGRGPKYVAMPDFKPGDKDRECGTCRAGGWVWPRGRR